MKDSDGRSISFKALPQNRLNIIRAVEVVGAEIKEFHTEPPNWEAMIGGRLKRREERE